MTLFCVEVGGEVLPTHRFKTLVEKWVGMEKDRDREDERWEEGRDNGVWGEKGLEGGSSGR